MATPSGISRSRVSRSRLVLAWGCLNQHFLFYVHCPYTRNKMPSITISAMRKAANVARPKLVICRLL